MYFLSPGVAFLSKQFYLSEKNLIVCCSEKYYLEGSGLADPCGSADHRLATPKLLSFSYDIVPF